MNEVQINNTWKIKENIISKSIFLLANGLK